MCIRAEATAASAAFGAPVDELVAAPERQLHAVLVGQLPGGAEVAQENLVRVVEEELIVLNVAVDEVVQVATAYERGSQVQRLLCGINDHPNEREDILVLQLPKQVTLALEGCNDVASLVWAERSAHGTDGRCIVTQQVDTLQGHLSPFVHPAVDRAKSATANLLMHRHFILRDVIRLHRRT